MAVAKLLDTICFSYTDHTDDAAAKRSIFDEKNPLDPRAKRPCTKSLHYDFATAMDVEKRVLQLLINEAYN